MNDLAVEANVVQSYMTESDQEKLIELLNTLPSSELDLIELRFFQQMSFKEIAHIYEMSEANAKMRTYRILKRINQWWTRNS